MRRFIIFLVKSFCSIFHLLRDWILLVCFSWRYEWQGPHVNFVMRETLFEIYKWVLCLSYLHEKQTSRIQSLYLYFIKIVLFWLWNIRFLIHNRGVFRTAGSCVTGTVSWKNGCQNFSMFTVAENTGSVNIWCWSFVMSWAKWQQSALEKLCYPFSWRYISFACYFKISQSTVGKLL